MVQSWTGRTRRKCPPGIGDEEDLVVRRTPLDARPNFYPYVCREQGRRAEPCSWEIRAEEAHRRAIVKYGSYRTCLYSYWAPVVDVIRKIGSVGQLLIVEPVAVSPRTCRGKYNSTGFGAPVRIKSVFRFFRSSKTWSCSTGPPLAGTSIRQLSDKRQVRKTVFFGIE